MVSVVFRRSLPMLLAVWTAMSTAVLRADDDVVPAENLLPKNVVLFVNIPDVTNFKEQLDESSFGDLLRDEALTRLRAEINKKIEEASKDIQRELGMSLAELVAIPSGKATLAIVQPPAAMPAGVVILDATDHEEGLEKLIEKAEGELSKNSVRSTSEFDGVEIVTWTKEDSDDQPVNSFSYIFEDSLFVVSNSIDVLKDVITRRDGEHADTFASHDVYSYILDATQDDESDPVLTWYIDPVGLIRTSLQAAGPEAGMQAAMAMNFLPVLGLDRLKGIGGILEIGTEDYEGISRTMIYAEQPSTGLVRIFRFPPINLAPPKFVPATVSNITGTNWDVQGAYTAIEQMVDFFTAPGTTKKFLDDAAQQGPMIHPKADFLDLLTGQNFIIQEMPEISEESGAPEQRVLVMLGVLNQPRIEEVVNKIATMDGAGIRTRDFNGTKIYEAQTGGRTPFEPAFAVSNGYLMFSSTASLLESLLRNNDGEALVDSEDYKTIAAEFPAEVSTFTFQRQADVMEGAYDLFVEMLSQNDDFDTSLLPEFEAIRKYFGLAGSYSIPDEKGVLMISFSLYPEE